MRYLKHLVRSKGIIPLGRRLWLILSRFGLTRARTERSFSRIAALARKHDFPMTFFITADLLDGHKDLIRGLLHNGGYPALHGYHHVDHAALSGDEQRAAIRKGVMKFEAHGIQVHGFRGPFLRFNRDTDRAVKQSGLKWVSHAVSFLDGDRWLEHAREALQPKDLVSDFYSERPYLRHALLPTWRGGCLEIPVCLPDDELLVDRLQITDPGRLFSIWSQMLDITRERHELLNLLFHPERIRIIHDALDRLMGQASGHGDLWQASLDEIADWWHERASFAFEIEGEPPNGWRVCARCSGRAQVLMEHPGGTSEPVPQAMAPGFCVPGPLRPAIYMPAGFCTEKVPCLVNEGYAVEGDGDPAQYALALEGTCSGASRTLLGALSRARGPLVRFARWPAGYTSAMAVSADVDAVTLLDFVRRACYFGSTRPLDSSRAGPSLPDHDPPGGCDN